MKVLFICSGNKQNVISPIIYNQGESIRASGVQIDYFPIIGKGLKGFLSHFFKLRQQVRNNNYLALHAHYSFYGFYTTMAFPFHKNIIVSLMGGIPKGTARNVLIRIFAKLSWKKVIVKSQRMADELKLKNIVIQSNGVDLEKFEHYTNRKAVRNELKFDDDKQYVIFLAHPDRKDKNFELSKAAVQKLKNPNVVLLPLFDKSHDDVVKHLIAADTLILSSTSEGSPNAIKEAMAAGCPIVATDVGNVRWLIGKTQGCYVLNSFAVDETAKYLTQALNFKERTKGPERIRKLNLDAGSVAKIIIQLYA